MKKIIIVLLGLVSISVNAQDRTISAFLEKWENSKNYLIGIAEAMPESNYDYKPTAREMSFKSQLLHIQGNMDWLRQAYFSKSKNGSGQRTVSKTKSEIIKSLKKSFDATSESIKKVRPEELNTVVDFFAGPKSKLQILNLLQDHVSHHRGQLIVYLNLNEIQPPEYVGW